MAPTSINHSQNGFQSNFGIHLVPKNEKVGHEEVVLIETLSVWHNDPMGTLGIFPQVKEKEFIVDMYNKL